MEKHLTIVGNPTPHTLVWPRSIGKYIVKTMRVRYEPCKHLINHYPISAQSSHCKLISKLHMVYKTLYLCVGISFLFSIIETVKCIVFGVYQCIWVFFFFSLQNKNQMAPPNVLPPKRTCTETELGDTKKTVDKKPPKNCEEKNVKSSQNMLRVS